VGHGSVSRDRGGIIPEHMTLAFRPPFEIPSGRRLMVEITRDRIDAAALTERVRSPLAGAVCTFLGTVRELTGDKRTAALSYEAYPEMAAKKLVELEAVARRRWPVVEATIVHRVGDLDLGEISVVVAVSCPW